MVAQGGACWEGRELTSCHPYTDLCCYCHPPSHMALHAHHAVLPKRQDGNWYGYLHSLVGGFKDRNVAGGGGLHLEFKDKWLLYIKGWTEPLTVSQGCYSIL